MYVGAIAEHPYIATLSAPDHPFPAFSAEAPKWALAVHSAIRQSLTYQQQALKQQQQAIAQQEQQARHIAEISLRLEYE